MSIELLIAREVQDDKKGDTKVNSKRVFTAANIPLQAKNKDQSLPIYISNGQRKLTLKNTDAYLIKQTQWYKDDEVQSELEIVITTHISYNNSYSCSNICLVSYGYLYIQPTTEITPLFRSQIFEKAALFRYQI